MEMKKMRRILAVSVCLALCPMTARAFQAGDILLSAAPSGVFLREQPSADAAKVDKVPYTGKVVFIREIADQPAFMVEGLSGNWIEVKYGSRTGYLFSGFVRQVQVPREGLAGEWLFTRDAQDTSGQQNHGQVAGAVLTVDRFGNTECAYAFDGREAVIRCGQERLTLNRNMTISLWFELGSGQKGVLISKGAQGFLTNWHILYDPEEDSLYFGTFGNTIASWPRPPVPGKWVHLAVTVGTERPGKDLIELYWNGKLADDYTTKPLTSTDGTPLFIGGFSDPSQNIPFHGLLDDIRVYDRVLTEMDIKNLYHEGNWN